MPVIRNPTPLPDPTPSPATGPSAQVSLSKIGDLTQFGAHLQVLPPGSRTSILHWHAAEDELIYVLAGTPTLTEGETETLLNPGDCATFKAGVAVGHSFANHNAEPVRLLVVGTRAQQDRVTYPLIDVILTRDRAKGTHGWTNAAGVPVGDPYA